MKLNVDGDLGGAVTYSGENSLSAPDFVKTLLDISGVKSVFVCANFLTLNKDPRVDWSDILTAASETLGGKILNHATTATDIQNQRESAAKDGQAHVLVQTFRGVPIQVKVEDSKSQTRVSLGERFNDAAKSIQDALGADFLKERYWADYGVRYGAPDTVAEEVALEITSLFGDAHLRKLVEAALGKGKDRNAEVNGDEDAPPDENWAQNPSWQKRLAAVQYFSSADDALESLITGLKDENAQVRRLAAAALGSTGDVAAVGPLSTVVLHDEHVGVRRTAGDALSDIGDSSAEPTMCQALKDKNKLVRWRAARFLFDLGTETSLPALHAAAQDSEFEVRLEIEAAIQRIGGKEAGMGPAWKRIIEGKS